MLTPEESSKHGIELPPLIYLAAPYSHEDEMVRASRALNVSRIAAKLISEGHHIFSPISHGHVIATSSSHPMRGDWKYWKDFNQRMILISDEVVVLTIASWQDSLGVQAEIAFAKKHKRQVSYLNYFEALLGGLATRKLEFQDLNNYPLPLPVI
jgi:hypothetical protein